MLAVCLLGTEKVEVERVAVLGESHRCLVEERRPLERCAVQTLALGAVAVLGIDRISMVLELDCLVANTTERK